MPTSPKTYVPFAYNAYYEDPNKALIPPGYTLLCECPEALRKWGYYGMCFYKEGLLENDPIEVVIAHRGTVLNKDIIDDLELMCHNAPLAFASSSKPFTQYVETLVREKFPTSGFTFIQTGHSLGSIHAELCTASQYENLTAKDSVYCIDFESPGSKPIVEKLIAENQLPADSLDKLTSTITCNADVNAINCFNEQVGQILKCNVGYDYPEYLLSFPINELYWLIDFTPDQHQIEKMLMFWQTADDNYSFEKNWPVGPEEGLAYYQAYSTHPPYWDETLQVYWSQRPEIQKKYCHDYEIYKQYMLKKYFDQYPALLTKREALQTFGTFAAAPKKSSTEAASSDAVILESNPRIK